ncbi:MAG: tRNA dihydrouridine synthase DusB [Clostridia bacterium]|nr:tRNA dihydrouridine synthase DusB [Clostridia bacterium]
MKIGSIEIKNNLILGPMAGVADMAFRELCVKFGAGFTVGEMVSAKGFTMGDRKSAELLRLSDKERPAGIQLFGTDPQIMADAAKRAMAFAPDAMDINMGCPAPKVANTGAGSALMKNLPLAKEIVRAVVKASEVPVTVKFRTGWDSESICAVELAKICEGEGAAAVTVHGRTRQQMYAFPIDFDTIAQVKQAVSIPVVGNGGIRDVQSAATMFYQTGCDAIMVAQGALGKPWLFQQIAAYLNHTIVLPDPPLEQQMLYMIRHIERIVAYKGEKVGMREARKHAAWYLKGNRGAAAYRRKCGELENIEQLKQLAAEVIASQHLGEKGEKPDDDEKGKNRKEV